MKAKNLIKRTDLIAVALLATLLLLAARPGVGQATERAAMPRQATATLTAVADATLKSWSPNTNFGGDSTLTVSHSHIDTDENAATLLRFDVSSLPSGAIIDNASIELYLESSSGLDPVDIGIYYNTSAWDESTVTWNTAPTVEAGPFSSFNWPMDSSSGWKTSTALLYGWVSSWMTGPNYGVMLHGSLTGAYYYRAFESRERNNHLPRLVVEYHLPTPTATHTPTPTGTPAPSLTPTITNTPTPTGQPASTHTPTPTRTSTPTSTPTPTRTPTTAPTTTWINFDTYPNGTRIGEQYANLGVHFVNDYNSTFAIESMSGILLCQ